MELLLGPVIQTLRHHNTKRFPNKPTITLYITHYNCSHFILNTNTSKVRQDWKGKKSGDICHSYPSYHQLVPYQGLKPSATWAHETEPGQGLTVMYPRQRHVQHYIPHFPGSERCQQDMYEFPLSCILQH